MQLPGMVKKRGSVVCIQQIWNQQPPLQHNKTSKTIEEDERGSESEDNSSSIHQTNSFDLHLEQNLVETPSFSTIDENDMDDHHDINSESSHLLVPLQRRNTTVVSNTSLSSMTDKVVMSTGSKNSKHNNDFHKATLPSMTSNIDNNNTVKHQSPTSAASSKGGVSAAASSNILPLYRHPSPQLIKDVQAASRAQTTPTTSSPTAMAHTKIMQLLVGTAGIYATYLYYGVVQEDLFRYRSIAGVGFSFVWALQVLESAVTMIIGCIGRKLCGGRKNLPLLPFFHSGVSQLAAKALMSLSLAAGLSFPVVVLAKSAKIVPVMIGQLVLGGSKYSFHDYLFAVMIVAGTSLLSSGNTSEHVASGSDTFTGLVLITLSLTADGFTGGLQKKLKRVTASMSPTTYDFLFYSHVAQFCAAIIICFISGDIYTAPTYLLENPAIWWWIGASCVCSAVGQCFIFYVISCFDPVVCTTITTTRKMLTVMFSIGFKGHHLSSGGYIGLGLAISALLLEVEAKYSEHRMRQKGMVEIKLSSANNLPTSTVNSTTQQSLIKSSSASSAPPMTGGYSA